MALTIGGTCRLCGKDFGKAQMTRHIKSCLAKKGRGSHLLLLVQDRSGRFWIYVTVAKSVQLWSLDEMLRDLWVECCGHMSAFSDGTVSYVDDPELGLLGGELGMDVSVEQAMRSKKSLKYEYDFGSTTELTIRIVGENMAGEENVELLARNNPPPINCHVCGKSATILNVEDWDPVPYCDDCGPSGDGTMTLPVINSPRMAVCGYAGPSVEP